MEIVFAPKPQTTRFKDIDGDRFGRLAVIGYKGPRGNHREWYCKCDCGEVCIVLSNCLLRGETKSCGCLNSEYSRRRKTTHGKTGTRVYGIWKHIITRCTNRRAKAFPRYGGKGVKVCSRWRSFQNFYADMGDPPSRIHSIDRRDNDGDYTPENCRWATPVQQQNNTSRNVKISINGRTQTLAEWCRELRLNYSTVHARLRKRWPVCRAFQIAD